MSKFIPRKSEPDAGVLKFAGGCGAPIPMPLEKTGRGEAELGLSGRVDHRNGDGVIHALSQLIPSIQSSLPRDPRLLTRQEKEKLLDQVVAAMRASGVYTSYGEDLARRIVGLDSLDGQVTSRLWEAQGSENSQATQRENGNYTVPSQPADTPRSVAKSDAADMREMRAKLADLRLRVEALLARHGR